MAVNYKKYTDQDLKKLTKRECEIFEMRRDGLRCQEIAEKLGIIERTVHTSLSKSAKKWMADSTRKEKLNINISIKRAIMLKTKKR